MPTSAERLPRPDANLHDVGPDTETFGRAKRQLQLLEYWGMTPNSDLLEIGCGVGRLAYEMASYLDGGSYTGFDIAEKPVKWLRKNYQSVLPNFRFDLIDAKNARYRPKKGKSAADVRFPYDDDQFDFSCSFAVFMHMRLEEITNYFCEVARVLRPEARAVLTMTAITEDDLAQPELPVLGNNRFIAVGDGIYAKRPDRPTYGLGFDRSLLADHIDRSGLDIVDFTAGTWRNPLDFDPPLPVIGGDVFVVTPKS